VESLQENAWPGRSDIQAWTNRTVQLEEKLVLANRYAAEMLEIAEEHAKLMSGLLEAETILEVTPDLWITRGLAVHHAKFRAEECKAMAEIPKPR